MLRRASDVPCVVRQRMRARPRAGMARRFTSGTHRSLLDDCQCSCTVTGAAKISDFLPVEGVALPQLTTTLFGESDEMPKVSPGHTDGSPKALATCMGSESQPLVTENARRYSAYP